MVASNPDPGKMGQTLSRMGEPLLITHESVDIVGPPCINFQLGSSVQGSHMTERRILHDGRLQHYNVISH